MILHNPPQAENTRYRIFLLVVYEERDAYTIKNALQESYCGGKKNDISYSAAGGEYALSRILSCIKGRVKENLHCEV